MVQTKRPPVVKWTPYNIGETKNQILKEINQIFAQKEHRKRIGLEGGALREFKGNTHWNLFVTIELAELLTKRINSDMKNVFLQTSQGLNNASSYLANITTELKKAEYNLNNVTTVSNNNVMKVIRSEMAKLNKTIASIVELEKNMKVTNDKLGEDLANTSGLIQKAVEENFQNILKELSERNEAMQTVITEDVHTFKDLNQTRFDELGDLVKVNFSEINEQAVNFNDNTKKSLREITDKVTEIGHNILDTQEQVITLQDATNNRFDESQSTLLKEFQEGIGGLMKQNLDNFDKVKKSENGQTREISARIDESTENLTSILEATNEHLDKVNENINHSMKLTEDQFTKDLKGEMTDLKTILGTIQSDINLMKSVLTKLDTKVH
jgi:regulator of replication initiation timing